MDKQAEKAIARKAPAALTRLRQGYNPFQDGQLDRLEKDKRMLHEIKYCRILQ